MSTSQSHKLRRNPSLLLRKAFSARLSEVMWGEVEMGWEWEGGGVSSNEFHRMISRTSNFVRRDECYFSIYQTGFCIQSLKVYRQMQRRLTYNLSARCRAEMSPTKICGFPKCLLSRCSSTNRLVARTVTFVMRASCLLVLSWGENIFCDVIKFDFRDVRKLI